MKGIGHQAREGRWPLSWPLRKGLSAEDPSSSADVADHDQKVHLVPAQDSTQPSSLMSLSTSLTPSLLIEQLRLLETQIPVCLLFSYTPSYIYTEAASRNFYFVSQRD